MSEICNWMEMQGMKGICRDILEHLTHPIMAGRITPEGLVVEAGNDFLREYLKDNLEALPQRVETLFASEGDPFDMTPLEDAARQEGWTRTRWSLLPGEKELNLFCYGDGKEFFLAFFDDRTSEMAYEKIRILKDRFLFLMNLYDVREMIPQMMTELIERLGVDWAGIFLWDARREQWILTGEEASPSEYHQDPSRNAVSLARTFSQHGVEGQGPAGHLFAGLNVEEGGMWCVPWISDEDAWSPLLEQAGFKSLFAGTIITGSNPAVLLCLARKTGCFARVNREALETVWPVFRSLAERNRAVSGISRLYNRDPVTGLYAAGMMKRVTRLEMSRSARYGYPLAAIAFRVVNMEALKKAGGIETVDEVLQILSRQVMKHIRTVDIAGRLGEDTVLLLLPHTPADGAETVAGRMRMHLQGVSPIPLHPMEIEVSSDIVREDSIGPDELLAQFGMTWVDQEEENRSYGLV